VKLTEKQLIHNSGQDLWDYFFNNVPLKYVGDVGGEEDMSEDPKWYTEGMAWFESQLLEGEKWDYYLSDKFVYTIYGRLANIKNKQWRRTQMQGAHITTTVDKGGISLSRLVYNRWGVKIDYHTLPSVIKDTINAESYLSKLEKKREKNGKEAG
jgi:hypothetical protein